jgi:hypothetical protein
MTDTLRILTFAGQAVPEDGLTIAPPQGGALTVWPDGGFAFTPSEGAGHSDGQDALTTYYSYDMQDIDGVISSGTFAFNPEEAAPAVHDFQAWSLPELLDGDGLASLDLTDAAAQGSVTFDAVVSETVISDHVGHTSDLASVASGSLFEDDVMYLLIHSQHG